MPLFMDAHDLSWRRWRRRTPRISPPRTRTALHYLQYWVKEGPGRIFCLVDAPDAEAAAIFARRTAWSPTRATPLKRATRPSPLPR